MTRDLDPEDFKSAMGINRRQVPAEQIRKFEDYVAQIFAAFGMDLDTPATRETPKRFIRAMFDATEGYDGDPKLLKVFETECRGGPDCRLSQVVEGPIHFYSFCEHHALPFYGHAYVGYIAHEGIIGLSKLTRPRPSVCETLYSPRADRRGDRERPCGDASATRGWRISGGLPSVHANARSPGDLANNQNHVLAGSLRQRSGTQGRILHNERTVLKNDLAPLESLWEVTTDPGIDLPLPAELRRLYGPLRFPLHQNRPYVIGNFVSTLDGVVSLNVPGQSGGGPISGEFQQDRMVMGLLRAVADAVVVGAGTLRAVRNHVWTPEYVWPQLADVYTALRTELGKVGPPLNVIVTASGRIDFSRRVFHSGEVPVLIITTPEGRDHICRHEPPQSVQVAALDSTGSLTSQGILDAISDIRRSDVILVEGGPQLIGDFFADQRLDELFLTLAPQIAGRGDAVERPGLVDGKIFAPENPLWGRLVGIKRGGSHLFLRYSFESVPL